MLELADKIAENYRKHVLLVADIVNALSIHVPRRRARKLHVGLFGYPRSVNSVQLPRAIPFCCSLYSIGLPPEIIGLGGLGDRELGVVAERYREELNFALRFFSKKVCRKLKLEKVYDYRRLEEFGFEAGDFELAEEVYEALKSNRISTLNEKILQAARERGFLG